MRDPVVTDHAVEQFIRRWEPTKSYDSAKDELEALMRTSKSTGTRSSYSGQIMTSGYRPEVRMIVKDGNVCITVLPPNNKTEDMLDEDALLAISVALSPIEEEMRIAEKDHANVCAKIHELKDALQPMIEQEEAEIKAIRAKFKVEMASIKEKIHVLSNERQALNYKISRSKRLIEGQFK